MIARTLVLFAVVFSAQGAGHYENGFFIPDGVCLNCAKDTSPGSKPRQERGPAPIVKRPQDDARSQASTINLQGVELYKKRDWSRALALFDEAIAKDPGNFTYQDNRNETVAMMWNDQGKTFSQRKDWTNAIASYKEALKSYPARRDNSSIQQNLTNAQQQQTNKVANESLAQQMQQQIQRQEQMTRTNNQILENARKATQNMSSGLDFHSGNPMVVDTRNQPPGLSQPVENAIAGVFSDAAPGVSDRVRKGFQAVAVRDWKVAKAWFEDALNRDPGNAYLRHIVDMVDLPKGNKQTREDSVPATFTLTSLNAKASKMSTEEIMNALGGIMEEHFLQEVLGPAFRPSGSKQGPPPFGQ